MPTEPAAVSLAAIACSARPMRERSMLRPMATQMNASTQTSIEEREVVGEARCRRARISARPWVPSAPPVNGTASSATHDEDEVQRERCHREHETAQLQDRRARSTQASSHRTERAGQQGGERIPAIVHAQDRAGVAADHAEAGLPERELMRIAEQQHEADGAGRHRAGDDADAERIAAAERTADRARTATTNATSASVRL